MFPRTACRSPRRLARKPPKTLRACGGPGMPIKGLVSGPAPVPGRIPAPGQTAAGAEQEWIPAPVAARRPDPARAPMPGSGRGPGLTTRRRAGAGRAPTAWHGHVPHAVLARRRPASLGRHGLQQRGGRAANPAPASESLTGTAAADRPVRPTPQGPAAGVPDRARTHRRPVPVQPCQARPPVPGVAAATVPVTARMRAARRKRWQGRRGQEAAAAGMAGPSGHLYRLLRTRWAVMSCGAAMRRPAATRRPAGPRHRAMTRPPVRTDCRAATHAARRRHRDARGPTGGPVQAGPPGGGAPRGGTRRPPGRREPVPRHRRVTSQSRAKPRLAGEDHAAGPRISPLP
jgi:hypothetical protein